MQTKLFFEDEYEALNLMVSTGTKSAKELACFLFPHLKMDSAYARLKACLNPEKDERLTFGQIIAAMRFCEAYHPLMYACDETLHERPDRRAVEEEAAKLAGRIGEATQTIERALKALEQLKSQGGFKGVA